MSDIEKLGYIKTEIFQRTLGRRCAEEIRHVSDDDDFYIVTKDEAGGMGYKILLI